MVATPLPFGTTSVFSATSGPMPLKAFQNISAPAPIASRPSSTRLPISLIRTRFNAMAESA